jgi:ribosome-binding protein aMBF1 (putative translation factor)
VNTQIITTPSGERMVILPEGEFQSLVLAAENAEDSAAVNEFEKRMSSGEEELLPAELANAILDGANPVRAWREYRGLTIKSLAQSASIAPAYLSQLETGQRDGTIETMKKLASGLGVLIDDLI